MFVLSTISWLVGFGNDSLVKIYFLLKLYCNPGLQYQMIVGNLFVPYNHLFLL